MSIRVFEMTEDHINVVKQIRWANVADMFYDTKMPFGSEQINRDICEIIYGMPPMDKFDPLSDEEPQFTQEQLDYASKILEEVPTALDIILSTGSFDAGTYATKHHIREWKKWDEAKIQKWKMRMGYGQE